MIQSNTKTRVVGVNITVEVTSFAIIDIRGDIVAEHSFATSDFPFVNDYIGVLSEQILNLVEQNGGYESIRSIGLSVPSGNYLTACIENASNLPWKGVIPLAAMLRDRLGLAVALGNNAHAMALGEQAFGAAHGMRDFVLITLSSGMGSCLCCNGNIHFGADGFAGEIGHICAVENGRLCGCGKHGCLETYTAGKGIVKTAQEVMAESQQPSMMRQVDNLTPKVISLFCDQGDELAIETYRRTGYMLGVGLANYASMINPEAFIFSGGISKAGKWLLDPTREAFDAHVFHNIEGKAKFLRAALDDHVRGMLGASVLAWSVKEYSLFK